MRALLFTLLIPLSAMGDDALPAEKLSLIKQAAVLVLVDNGETAGTGSGFVIRVDGTTGYIATNNHVIDLSDGQRARGKARNEAVEVVFDSGQIGERVVKAEVIAADPDRDLAILKVTNVKALPAPIPLKDPPKLAETMSVLVCGFPFGDSLATSRKHPAITISTSTVSSIRLDDAGRVSVVQLAGSALNPGNSGGAIVTPDGRLVGVAVAAIRGAGIGFAVPHHELARLLAGRIGRPAVFAIPVDSTTVQLRIEGPLLDPFRQIKIAAVYHKAVTNGERTPHPDAKGQWPAIGTTPVEAAIQNGWAVATVRVPQSQSSTVLIQFEFRTAVGLTREEPIELKWPAFAAGSKEGRYLTSVRNETRETRTPGPKGQVLLKDVNRTPDLFLGQSVTIDGVLTQLPAVSSGKETLAIGYDRQSKPGNLRFVAAASLAASVREAAKSETRSVRIVGTVLAPTSPNAPYTVEVEELIFLGDDGTVQASYKPTAPVAVKPAPVTTPAPPVAVAPAVEPITPVETPPADLPLGTLIGVALAGVVGLGTGGFMLYRRQSAHAAGKTKGKPAVNVAERLNRRTK